MIYPIHILGLPILRKVAENISPEYPNIQQLVADMFETLKASDGVGLAAPQIGLSIRMFVVDASPFADDEPQLADFKKVFINAKIIERTGKKEYFNEGCLSIPGIHEDVLRETVIRIDYLDENFQPHSDEFDGVPARIIQHEYDHLEGLVFTDRVSPIRKQMIKSKINAIVKGRFEANYKYKMMR